MAEEVEGDGFVYYIWWCSRNYNSVKSGVGCAQRERKMCLRFNILVEVGKLTHWHSTGTGTGTGTLAHWHTGTLAHWHTGTLAHRHTGKLAHWHTGKANSWRILSSSILIQSFWKGASKVRQEEFVVTRQAMPLLPGNHHHHHHRQQQHHHNKYHHHNHQQDKHLHLIKYYHIRLNFQSRARQGAWSECPDAERPLQVPVFMVIIVIISVIIVIIRHHRHHQCYHCLHRHHRH